MPHSSANVHVLTTTNELSHVPGVTSSTGLTVISPIQLSTAVKSVAAGTSASHSTNMSAGASGATGAVSSVIVILAVLTDSFPQSSVAVNVTSTMNGSAPLAQGVLASRSAISPRSLSIVTSKSHASLAVTLSNQAFTISIFDASPHSRLRSPPFGPVSSGAISSVIVNVP